MKHGRLPKFDEHDVYNIRKQFENSVGIPQLANKYGVSRHTIENVINKRGIYAGNKLTERWDAYEDVGNIRSQVKKLRSLGYKFEDIAQRFGKSKAWAHAVYKKIMHEERAVAAEKIREETLGYKPMKQTQTLKSIALGRSDLFKIDPNDIHTKDGWNAREGSDPQNQEHIEMLARSIVEIGQKEPLTVYLEDDKVYVSDGHCRLAAIRMAMEAGVAIKYVTVKSEPRYSNDADRVLALMVRNSGKPLTPYEQSGVARRLIDYGWTKKQIAERTGLSPVRISQLLEFQTVPEEVQKMVAKGEVSATMATETVKEEGGEAAVEMLTDAVRRAKEQGKSRATPKHKQPKADVSASKKRPLTIVTEIIGRASSVIHGDSVMLKMSQDDWEVLCRALDIDPGNEAELHAEVEE